MQNKHYHTGSTIIKLLSNIVLYTVTLREINLSKTSMDNNSVIGLCEGLFGNRTVRVLNLSYNR